MHKTIPSLLFILLIASTTFIVGCGSSVPMMKPFKMEIQQGNVVTSKMLLQLRPGMTKSQVKFIMGTPLVVDSFHTDRWDYFYQLRQAGKVVEQRRVILDFQENLLARVRGDVVPQGTAGADTGAVVLSKEPAPASKPAGKEGILESLKFWKNRDAAEKTQPKAVESITEPVAPEKIPVPKEMAPTEPAKLESAPEVVAPAGEPAAETPSMLSVPISIVPVDDVPPIESQAVTKPVEAAPVAPKSADFPIKPDSAIKQDEERVLRLDRDLDTKNIDSKNATQEPTKSTTKPIDKPNNAQDQPLLDEEEPGYFERLLEKIGF